MLVYPTSAISILLMMGLYHPRRLIIGIPGLAGGRMSWKPWIIWVTMKQKIHAIAWILQVVARFNKTS